MKSARVEVERCRRAVAKGGDAAFWRTRLTDAAEQLEEAAALLNEQAAEMAEPDICAICGVDRDDHPRGQNPDPPGVCTWFHRADSYPKTEKTPFGRACPKCCEAKHPGRDCK